VHDEWLLELKEQLEVHSTAVFTLENSDGVVLEITDVRFEDDRVQVKMSAVDA
jgi:hypothetical protein